MKIHVIQGPARQNYASATGLIDTTIVVMPGIYGIRWFVCR